MKYFFVQRVFGVDEWSIKKGFPDRPERPDETMPNVRTFTLPMGAKIGAISYYLPEKVYSNVDFFKDFPDSLGSSLEKTGVIERHIIGADETASDMAEKAALKLFSEHQIDPQSIDFLILCNLEPDYYTPATSAVLHGKLGLPEHCGVLDYNHGCSAYIYGIGMAEGAMLTSGAKRVLLLTTSALTHTFHPKDKSSKFIFGDAASATIIDATDTGMIGPYIYGTDGRGFNRIIKEDGGARNPITDESQKEITDEYGNTTSRGSFYMNGNSVFLFTLKKVPQMIAQLLAKAGLQTEDIDQFVFHQPNEFLNETLRKKIGIPEEKFIHHFARTGNTVQATIPICLHKLREDGKLKPGTTALLAGFGVGLSWNCVIARF